MHRAAQLALIKDARTGHAGDDNLKSGLRCFVSSKLKLSRRSKQSVSWSEVLPANKRKLNRHINEGKSSPLRLDARPKQNAA